MAFNTMLNKVLMEWEPWNIPKSVSQTRGELTPLTLVGIKNKKQNLPDDEQYSDFSIYIYIK